MSPLAIDGAFSRPPPRPAEVPRDDLLNLASDGSHRVVVVSAPAGFGKSILTAQWCTHDPNRPYIWLGLSFADNDPATLLSRLITGLDLVAPVDAQVGEMVVRRSTDHGFVLGTLSELLAERSPTLVAFDDVHLVTSDSSTKVLRHVVTATPASSQVLLAGRREPDVGLARLRVSGDLLEIRAPQLTMDLDTATKFLGAAKARFDPDAIAGVHARTEGWPAGLALAALSAGTSAGSYDLPPAVSARPGEIEAYLLDEVLSQQSESIRQFLLQTSVVGRFCEPLCRAMLEGSGTTAAMDHLDRTDLMVIPLDNEGIWYRYHHLFQEVLARQLERDDPSARERLLRRAAAWHDHHGTIDEGLEYAQASGDLQLAGRLVLGHWEDYASRGQIETLRLALLRSADAEIESDASLAIGAAWVFTLLGDVERAERYAAAAAFHELDVPAADGASSLRSSLANLRSGLGSSGATQMLEDATFVYESERPARTRWLIGGCRAKGAAHLILGNVAESIAALDEALLLTEHRVPLGYTRVFCLGYAALAHQDNGDWERAGALTAEAEAMVIDLGLSDTLQNLPVRTARAVLAARANDRTATSVELEAVTGLLTFTQAGVWMLADLSVRCAEAALGIGDREAATTFATQARRAIARLPDSGVIPDRLERLEQQMLPPDPVLDLLTPAERRVLAELPSHFTVAEIADRLFVSRSTVKTHVYAIYSKLGVGSRAEAVARFAATGIRSAEADELARTADQARS